MDIEKQFRRRLSLAAEDHGGIGILAQRAGVSRSSLYAYMHGQQKSLSWTAVSKLCNLMRLQLKK